MILVFGGTTEGRICVEVLDEAGTSFYYSTKGSMQSVTSHNGIRLTGGMNLEEMTSFCKEHDIRMIIDAAHPFARELHDTVAAAAQLCGIPAVRYERVFPGLNPKDIVCDDYHDAVCKMKQAGVKHLLALTGVKTISALKDFWNSAADDGNRVDCHFRILDRQESFDIAEKSGFPKDRLLFYDKEQSTLELITRYRPDAIITKESGESGGFEEKEQSAVKAGVPLYVVRRPLLSDDFITVTGRHGLRRIVEQLVPGFYMLKTGFTTGSCATVAAKAALEALVGNTGCGIRVVTFTLPDGEHMRMESTVVEVGEGYAVASTIKDAGDDPDVINHHEIMVKVAFAGDDGRTENIRFLGGKGVGTITLPGIGIPVGEPAINKTPRKMICQNLSPLYGGRLDVTISVPDGEELAKKTFNPRLGIIGGISIIGTSGIVRPFSADAFIAAVKREMEVAVALGAERLVINSGAKSESYLKKQYPDLMPQAFIHYGNFIGGSLEKAGELNIKKVTMGIMIGKAVKLAAGHLDTHSRNVVMDREFLKKTAVEAGCSSRTCDVIDGINLARELWNGLDEEDGRKFFGKITELCSMNCKKVYDTGELTLMLIDEDGDIRQTVIR